MPASRSRRELACSVPVAVGVLVLWLSAVGTSRRASTVRIIRWLGLACWLGLVWLGLVCYGLAWFGRHFVSGIDWRAVSQLLFHDTAACLHGSASWTSSITSCTPAASQARAHAHHFACSQPAHAVSAVAATACARECGMQPQCTPHTRTHYSQARTIHKGGMDTHARTASEDSRGSETGRAASA